MHYAKSLGRIAWPLLLVLTLVGVGCAGQGNTTGPLTPQAAPSKTLKPTFTPLPEVTEESTTATAQPTQEPSLAPTLTPKAQQAESTATTTASETKEQAATPTKSTPTQAPAPQAKSLRMSSPEYGMQIFPWWRPEVGSRDMGIVREAGFGWVKVNFGWRDIEGDRKGAFDWSRTDKIVKMANEIGVDLMIRIDHQPAWAGGGFPTNGPPDNTQDLVDFLTALVSRYKGRIRAYEVWNEPNLAREWGGKLPDPGAYVKMLRPAYQAIKAADPNAMVISAGLSPTGTWNEESRPDDWYLESMYIAMGKSDRYFDVLGAHGAGYKSPPEQDPAQVAADPNLGGHRSFCFRRVEDLRAIMVKYGDANKQVALLEFGWTSDPRADSPYNWHMVSEETKADYLMRAYQYAKQNWSPWIGLMSLIYVCDPDWKESNEQYWWSISYPGWPEFKPRPAYTTLRQMAK
jgi:hypothetical protein